MCVCVCVCGLVACPQAHAGELADQRASQEGALGRLREPHGGALARLRLEEERRLEDLRKQVGLAKGLAKFK